MTTLERPETRPTADDPRADDPAAPLGRGRRASRLPRPFQIVCTGGVSGVMTLGARLCELGYRLPDFSVDVHEGVSCTGVACTVALTSAECGEFADRVRCLPGVLSVEPT